MIGASLSLKAFLIDNFNTHESVERADGRRFFCFSQISSKVRMELGSRGKNLAIVSEVFNGALPGAEPLQAHMKPTLYRRMHTPIRASTSLSPL